MAGILKVDELWSTAENEGIKLKSTLTREDGTTILTPAGDVSINFDDLADDQLSGNVIHGGTISGFQSTGITDNSSNTVIIVHSNENVGIGTDDPYSELTVAGSNSSTQVYKEDPVILLSKSSGTRVLDEGPSIGFNSGTSFLYGAIKGAAESSAAEFSGYLSFYTTGVTSYHSEQMRIDSSGNVGIGTINPAEKLTVSGNITASGDVTSTSDVRVKTDITPITGALDIVNKLEGKRFNKFNKPGIGFIAQELEQYMPELVHTANDEVGTKSVNYANMVALLVEAIKEQQVTINKLESKLNGN